MGFCDLFMLCIGGTRGRWTLMYTLLLAPPDKIYPISIWRNYRIIEKVNFGKVFIIV